MRYFSARLFVALCVIVVAAPAMTVSAGIKSQKKTVRKKPGRSGPAGRPRRPGPRGAGPDTGHGTNRLAVVSTGKVTKERFPRLTTVDRIRRGRILSRLPVREGGRWLLSPGQGSEKAYLLRIVLPKGKTVAYLGLFGTSGGRSHHNGKAVAFEEGSFHYGGETYRFKVTYASDLSSEHFTVYTNEIRYEHDIAHTARSTGIRLHREQIRRWDAVDGGSVITLDDGSQLAVRREHVQVGKDDYFLSPMEVALE